MLESCARIFVSLYHDNDTPEGVPPAWFSCIADLVVGNAFSKAKPKFDNRRGYFLKRNTTIGQVGRKSLDFGRLTPSKGVHRRGPARSAAGEQNPPAPKDVRLSLVSLHRFSDV
jgi:hypothetical protein